MNKIISIKEKQPVEVKLPDGIYTGIWGGYSIDIHYNQKEIKEWSDNWIQHNL